MRYFPVGFLIGLLMIFFIGGCGSSTPVPTLKQTDEALVRDVAIRIASVRIGTVRLRGEQDPDEDFLVISLQLENRHETAEREYLGFAGGSARAEIRDDKGNEIEQRRFGLAVQIQNSVEVPYKIRPGMRVTDTLVFDLPKPGTKSLVLELPEHAVGGDGELVYRLDVPK